MREVAEREAERDILNSGGRDLNDNKQKKCVHFPIKEALELTFSGFFVCHEHNSLTTTTHQENSATIHFMITFLYGEVYKLFLKDKQLLFQIKNKTSIRHFQANNLVIHNLNPFF